VVAGAGARSCGRVHRRLYRVGVGTLAVHDDHHHQHDDDEHQHEHQHDKHEHDDIDHNEHVHVFDIHFLVDNHIVVHEHDDDSAGAGDRLSGPRDRHVA